MRKLITWAMVSCLALIAPAAGRADFNQIPGVFAPTTALGLGTAYRSTFDTDVLPPGDLRHFSVGYDDVTSVGTTGALTSLTWVGKYELGGGPTTTSFLIQFYADNGLDRPVNNLYAETPLYSQTVTATEVGTGVPTLGQDNVATQFFQYTAAVPTFLMAPDTKYWLSISGVQSYGANGFGWAFSNTGNSLAIGDNQPGTNAAIVRSVIPSDFAFNATIEAVPEPSSCLLLAGALGTIGVRKWRARRKVAA